MEQTIYPIRDFHVDGSLPGSNVMFIYGSNREGIHGAGAAKVAREKFGAALGIGRGPVNYSYGIVTRFLIAPSVFGNCSLEDIQHEVQGFVRFTHQNPKLRFFVTSVGCGRAGYNPSQIAWMFREAINCSFPEEWSYWLHEADNRVRT